MSSSPLPYHSANALPESEPQASTLFAIKSEAQSSSVLHDHSVGVGNGQNLFTAKRTGVARVINEQTAKNTNPFFSDEESSNKGSSRYHITVKEVSSLFTKLLRVNSKRKPVGVSTDKSSTGSDTEVHSSSKFKPDFYLPTSSNHDDKDLLSILSCERNPHRWSFNYQEVQWSKLAWLIAPLRKWDTITQTSRLWASKPSDMVQIRHMKQSQTQLGSELLNTHELPVTIPTQFLHMAEQYPKRLAIMEKDEKTGAWMGITYKEMRSNVNQMACSIIQTGITPSSAIIIAAATTTSIGVLFTFACYFAATPVLVVDNLCDLHIDVLKFLIKKGEVEMVVTDNHADSLYLIQRIELFPKMKVIVDLESKMSSSKKISTKGTLWPFGVWYELGKSVTKMSYDSYMTQHQTPNRIALIKPQYFGAVSSSKQGTSESHPLCIMLTHDSLVYNSRRVARTLNIKNGQERWLSHLKWTQVINMEVTISPLIGVTLYIAPPDSLVELNLFKICKEIAPTLFATTNSTWQILIERLIKYEDEQENRGFIGAVKKWARNQGKTLGLYIQTGEFKCLDVANRIKFRLADKLVFSKLRAKLGLHKAYNLHSAGVSTKKETRIFRICVGPESLNDMAVDFMRSVNLPLLTWYMSDETGTFAVQTDRFAPGAQASLLEGIECESLSKSKRYQDELSLAGRAIFSGYLGDERATEFRFRKSNHFYMSGYQGANYKRQVLIAKRLEPFILTVSGKMIAHKLLEARFLDHLPAGVIQDCVLIGEGMPSLQVLVSFKAGKDNDVLTNNAIAWCRKLGSSAVSPDQLMNYGDRIVRDELLKIAARVNNQLHCKEMRITNVIVLPRPLEDGIEIDSDTKEIKRNIVNQVFQRFIKPGYSLRWKLIETIAK